MILRVYTRNGCHLCDEALALAHQLLVDDGRVRIEPIDIEGDDDLHRRYLELIPVFEFDGEELLRLDQFRDGGLQRALVVIDEHVQR
ncbi:MAG: glutaredoxin family protein [Solirubrobacterales bacterium]